METSKLDIVREDYAAVGDVRALDVLELGCGTGRHTRWLASCAARVIAIDLSPGMLTRRVPLADAAFNLIVRALVPFALRRAQVP